MRLDQNPRPVSQRSVPGREARRAAEVDNPFRQIAIVFKFEIPRYNITGSLHFWRHLLVKNVPLPGEHARWYGLMMLMVIRDVVAIVSAVRYMTINKKIRLPLVPEPEPRTRLWRACFHVIAIEIQICTGGAPAHLGRTILIDAIIWTKPLVAVCVVNRHEEHHHIFEQISARPGDGNVA